MSDGSIRTIYSSQGSHQGDPAGSFLFSLGLAPKLRSMAQELPNCFIGAIIDDITVCSPIQLIPRVIQVVHEILEAYNIEISLPKCLIYTLPEHSPSIPVEVPPIMIAT